MLHTIHVNHLSRPPQAERRQHGADNCRQHLQVRVHQALEKIQQHKQSGEVTCEDDEYTGNLAHANGVSNLPGLSRISILSSQISRWLSASCKTLFRLIQIIPFQRRSRLFPKQSNLDLFVNPHSINTLCRLRRWPDALISRHYGVEQN